MWKKVNNIAQETWICLRMWLWTVSRMWCMMVSTITYMNKMLVSEEVLFLLCVKLKCTCHFQYCMHFSIRCIWSQFLRWAGRRCIGILGIFFFFQKNEVYNLEKVFCKYRREKNMIFCFKIWSSSIFCYITSYNLKF